MEGVLETGIIVLALILIGVSWRLIVEIRQGRQNKGINERLELLRSDLDEVRKEATGWHTNQTDEQKRYLEGLDKQVESFTTDVVSTIRVGSERAEVLAQNQSQDLKDLIRGLEPVHQAFRSASQYAPWISTPFPAALSLVPLLEASERIGQRRLLAELLQYSPDAAVAVANVVSVAQQQGQIIVKFSKVGQELLKAQELFLDGKGLPQLKDSAGKIRHLARSVETGTKTFAQAASLGAAVVSVAHIISGADNAKKLQAVSRGMDILVQARQNDQVASLEADYIYCQRLLSKPVDLADLKELRRVVRDLHCLRSQLRRDFQFRLEQVEEPSLFANFCGRIGVTSLADGKLEKQILSARDQLELFRFTFLFQLTLEETLGTCDGFLQFDIPAEADALSKVDELFQSKVGKLSDNSSNQGVEEMQKELALTREFIAGFTAPPSSKLQVREVSALEMELVQPPLTT